MHPTSILTNYTYIDLEVDQEKNIYRFGLVSRDLELDTKVAETAQESLEFFHKQGLQICGHNFRRFDYRYLIKSFSTLKHWLVIDTLELSVLAFPLERSHKLNKEYKLSEYEGNNPLEDALATRKLLEKILHTFNAKSQELLNFYAYLLSCGEDEASQAYRQFFAPKRCTCPDINMLSETAIDGIDTTYLHEFITQAPTKNFDQRLCVAGIVAWNYESNSSNTKPPLSAWLSRFPDFPSILNQLKPIQFPREFTYQPYLQEFGVSEFRSEQEAAIQSILAVQNPLILMATGVGKSLCYQLPALMLSQRQRGLTVVISPLQALMADQVNGLMEKGLDFATFINGNITPAERRERLEQLRNGEKDLLYISAEQLRSPSIRALLQERLPSLIVFDEAHCISQWGHDFRPDYRYAPKFISELYQKQQHRFPLMAFMTATATVAVRQDIKSLFAAHQILIHTEICSSSKRENLEYRIIPTSKQAKDQTLIAEVKHALTRDGAVLVYTTTRKNTARLAQLLNENEVEARFYHGKISKEDKHEILQQFKDRELNVVVATCAFGMGIDRPDVRAVIHHTMSGNLEGYVQEAGRAGRNGEPSTCTLLFDPQDADTVFFLQSLNQLSEKELLYLFFAIASLKKQIQGKDTTQESFWITANEIYQASDLDEEFASETEQRDTKIKVALHYLEIFGLIERAENQSSFIEFELVYPTPQESLNAFDLYAHKNNLPNYRKDEFHNLILAMHTAKAYSQDRDEPFPLERLSDNSGIAIKELRQHVKELQRAEVCTAKMPITLLVAKGSSGSKGAAKGNYEKLKKIEKKIIEEITNLLSDRQEIQINCRGLATRLDPGRKEKLSAAKILDILEGWKYLGWIEYRRVNRDIVVVKQFTAKENFDVYSILIEKIISDLYGRVDKTLEKTSGARLRLQIDIHDLLAKVNQLSNPQSFELEDLETAIAWMHRHRLIRLADGLNLFYQAMKVRLLKEGLTAKGKLLKSMEKDITKAYPKIVKPHYEEQARRTHIMLEYGKQHEKSGSELQEYIEDYFSLLKSQFSTQYPNTDGEAAKRPSTQEDYDRIIHPLNSIQREIVLSESSTISVIAGPGSGKTRTIVHRIAYLVKVKRVDPARIIALAYNRNAVRELRLRLQYLVGELASRLRVYTFHGLSLAILGRTVEQTNNESQTTQRKARDPNQKFTQLIKDACNFLANNEDEEDTGDEDNQLRISRILGNCEFIFVDEYQDVAEQEYRLVKLIAGLQREVSDQNTFVQTSICVIGDDDQNIYEWRGTSTQYIRSFQAEYQAKQFLLTENYRSTEAIIAAANRLIQNNSDRLKHRGDQQVRIDNERTGQGGLNIQSLKFEDDNYQAEYIKCQVEKWIKRDGVKPGEIAILARNWQHMDKARALLERRVGIPTYSLKGEDIKLIRNRVTQLLISALEKKPDLILSKEESVKDRFENFFKRNQRCLSEPTVKTLIKIAEDIDKERGYGSENLSTPISISEIITSIYEFNESPDISIDPDAVLVTSCHGAKGLEFKYVILIADGFDYRQDKIESERRLFYVAMTRAKEKLILTHSQNSRFIQESEATPYPIENISIDPPQFVFYVDLSPYGSLVKDGGDINLGYKATRENQDLIKQLQEGNQLKIKINRFQNNWGIYTSDNIEIGELSSNATIELARRNIELRKFQFQDKEVTVRNVYRHLKTDEVNGDILEDWYVVVPQIRICR
ncbi:RecQ family ATP-dependent DNA helicase [Pantanalinema rosaneae CENA516]|uniref:RecQ family ATP-dependent DNA helicase n=1 Tax=Pantanalinema rosaneae TaxID=1620701 RepID=UPI003D6FCA5E